jgi:GTP-binding protein
MDELRSAVLERIAAGVEGGTQESATESGATDMRLAVLGKPNTGKSTLVNRLTGTEGSLVSEVPGTTRDVLEGRFLYKDMSYRILDTAGIRRKRSVREDVEYYSVNRAIGSIRDADVVLLVIDVVEGLSDQDKKIAQLVVQEGRGIVLVLSKWDLLPDVGNQFAAMQDKVRFFFPVLDFAPIVRVSALNGTGMKKLLDTTYGVYRQLHRRVDTSDLNVALRRWVEQTPPPRDNGRAYRVRYATQISAKPVRFVFFVNRRRGFPRPYVQYLMNRVRSDLGFSMVPIRIEIRES